MGLAFQAARRAAALLILSALLPAAAQAHTAVKIQDDRLVVTGPNSVGEPFDQAVYVDVVSGDLGRVRIRDLGPAAETGVLGPIAEKYCEETLADREVPCP